LDLLNWFKKKGPTDPEMALRAFIKEVDDTVGEDPPKGSPIPQEAQEKYQQAWEKNVYNPYKKGDFSPEALFSAISNMPREWKHIEIFWQLYARNFWRALRDLQTIDVSDAEDQGEQP
jgi:hypothetical protein